MNALSKLALALAATLCAQPAWAAGGLSTHVLDTTLGKPAAGVTVALYALDPDRKLLKRLETDADGRIRELLTPEEMKPGRYELVFAVGRYFGARAGVSPRVPFLSEIPVRFGIERSDEHYHVPLLVTPYSYATYRGS